MKVTTSLCRGHTPYTRRHMPEVLGHAICKQAVRYVPCAIHQMPQATGITAGHTRHRPQVPGWLGGWLSGWVAGWLGGWVAGWLAGWQGGWLAGWLAAATIIMKGTEDGRAIRRFPQLRPLILTEGAAHQSISAIIHFLGM